MASLKWCFISDTRGYSGSGGGRALSRGRGLGGRSNWSRLCYVYVRVSSQQKVLEKASPISEAFRYLFFSKYLVYPVKHLGPYVS